MGSETRVFRYFSTFSTASEKAKEISIEHGCETLIEERSRHSWAVVVPVSVYLALVTALEDDCDSSPQVDDDADHYVEPVSCGNCGGFGRSPTGGICPRCDGEGSFERPSTGKWGPLECCRPCGGDGCDEMGYECNACKGKGKVSLPK